jgi:hypothetical protein
MVLEGIRSTVNQLGRDIGRTTFLGIFPGQENAFDRFFNQAAETQRLLGEVA